MPNWVALIRGINVGGNNLVRMAALRTSLNEGGLTNVMTYLQSGNVAFRSTIRSAKQLEGLVAEHIDAICGFRPDVLILKPVDLTTAIQDNPFSVEVDDPSRMQFYFLRYSPKRPDQESLEALRTRSERTALVGRVFYLYAPDGIGRSRLAASAEKHLGVVATARNLKTVRKLLALAEGSSE